MFQFRRGDELSAVAVFYLNEKVTVSCAVFGEEREFFNESS